MATDYPTADMYILDLEKDSSLAIIPFTMASEIFDISRAAVEARVRSGTLVQIVVRGTRYILASSIFASISKSENVKSRIREMLIDLAGRGETITYGTLIESVGLKPLVPADRTKVFNILDDINQDEFDANGGILLSAIVHNKAKGIPGGGFFSLADRLNMARSSDTSFVEEQMAKVFEFYKK
jgi:hypothetical protein